MSIAFGKHQYADITGVVYGDDQCPQKYDFARANAMIGDWILIVVNSALSALLLRASAEKIARPGVTVAALREISPGGRADLTVFVRAVAVLEAVTALAIAVPVLRLPDQVPIGVLGGAFLVLGVVGRLRGSSTIRRRPIRGLLTSPANWRTRRGC